MKCCFCDNLDAKKSIKPSANFTDYDILKSNYICDFCNNVYTNQKYRRSCWILNKKETVFFKKNEIFYNLLNIKNDLPFKVFITTSYKKHGYYKTIWNYNINNFMVRFDDLNVFFEKEKALEISNMIIIFYYSGFTKKEIETGNYNLKKILIFGKNKWKKNEDKIKKIRNTPIFKFLLYCINPKEAKYDGK